jgi:hypothetical protein
MRFSAMFLLSRPMIISALNDFSGFPSIVTAKSLDLVSERLAHDRIEQFFQTASVS